MLKSKIPPYIKAVYISLLIIIIVFFMIMAKKLIVPLMISGYVAMLMTPLCDRLERIKIPRALSVIIVLLSTITAVNGLIFLIFLQIKSFVKDIDGDAFSKCNSYIVQISKWLHETFSIETGMENGFKMDRIIEMADNSELGMGKMILSTVGTLSDLLLLPVFIFFLLLYRDHLAIFLTRLFKEQKQDDVMAKIVSIRKIVQNYLVGASKVMVILGIVNSIVLFSLGIKHAIFFGMIAGMLNIIPYLGPMVGALLPFLFALITKDSFFYPAAVVVSFTIIQLVESSYLTPRITGSNVNLNALVTFIGLLIGGTIWGLMGMILIIPTIAILKNLFELSPETRPYAYLFGEEQSYWFRKKKQLLQEVDKK